MSNANTIKFDFSSLRGLMDSSPSREEMDELTKVLVEQDKKTIRQLASMCRGTDLFTVMTNLCCMADLFYRLGYERGTKDAVVQVSFTTVN